MDKDPGAMPGSSVQLGGEPDPSITTDARSNRLPFLADAVSRAHVEAGQHTMKAAERALDAGNALNEAKELCAHGEWLPWLRGTGLNERTAQRYMKLAASNMNSDTVSLLGGMMPALRFLRLRKIAHDQLCAAEEANRLADEGIEELVALETAILAMERMIAMFPPEPVEPAV